MIQAPPHQSPSALTSRSSVLVTGATGFTGGHLARELSARGHRVRALVRRGSNSASLQRAGIDLVEGDLTRRDDCLRAAKGAEVIFHIAAAYRTARQPDSYYHDVNVGGTEHIIAAATHTSARLVHCSTIGVHGHITHAPGREDTPYAPGDIYQLTKVDGERKVHSAMALGLPAVIARPAAIYGPSDTRLLKLFRSIQRGRFMMFGRGHVNYHLVYIDDLVEGFIQCASTPALGQTFILAGPRATSLRELVSLVAKAVGAPAPRRSLPLSPLLATAAACEGVCRSLRIEPPLHRRRADFFVNNREFSIDKARRVLGYDPQVGPEEGLQRTARWYASQNLLAAVPEPPGQGSQAMPQEVVV